MAQITIDETRYQELLACEVRCCSQYGAKTTRNTDLILEAIRRAAENPNTPENMCVEAEARNQFKALYQGGDRGRQKAWKTGISQLTASGRISINGYIITISTLDR